MNTEQNVMTLQLFYIRHLCANNVRICPIGIMHLLGVLRKKSASVISIVHGQIKLQEYA